MPLRECPGRSRDQGHQRPLTPASAPFTMRAIRGALHGIRAPSVAGRVMGGQPTPLLDETEFVDRIRAGDPAAEAELVRRHEPGLLAIAIVRAGREVAADLVQETLAAAIANLRRGDWRGEGTLAAYLAAILRHLIHRAHAQHAPKGDASGLDGLLAPGDDPLEAVRRREARFHVRRALLQLTPPQREVMVRHYLEGQSAEEIAHVMGTPRGTVLSRLHYARLEMARLLNPGGRFAHKDHGSGEL